MGRSLRLNGSLAWLRLGALVAGVVLVGASVGFSIVSGRAAGPALDRELLLVREQRAASADLSPDESTDPFFAPTLGLGTGQVYQAAAYMSPDTRDLVISNSTVLPGLPDGEKAIVHFEVSMASFADISSDPSITFLIVDATTGMTIAESGSSVAFDDGALAGENDLSLRSWRNRVEATALPPWATDESRSSTEKERRRTPTTGTSSQPRRRWTWGWRRTSVFGHWSWSARHSRCSSWRWRASGAINVGSSRLQ